MKSTDGTEYYLTGEKQYIDPNNPAKLVVFIHGIGSCSDQFKDIVMVLESHGHIVLTYDLIGML